MDQLKLERGKSQSIGTLPNLSKTCRRCAYFRIPPRKNKGLCTYEADNFMVTQAHDTCCHFLDRQLDMGEFFK